MWLKVFCKILPSVANYCKILEDVSTHTGSCLKWCMALERTAKHRIVFSSYCKTVKSICTHTRVCQRLLQDTLSTIAHASLPKLCKSQHCAVWKNTQSQLSRFSLQTLIGMCFKHMECVSNTWNMFQTHGICFKQMECVSNTWNVFRTLIKL